MKVGILTFVPSMNYGGLLQCAALKKTLESMGHLVSVFRRVSPWLDQVVYGPYSRWTKRDWLKYRLRTAFCLDDTEKRARYTRTHKFFDCLGLFSWEFQSWADAPAALDLDLLIVGSDQVWHCGDWGNPAPFLLEGAPNIRVISYAASFGMPEIPRKIESGLFTGDDIPARYKEGLAKFSAISCREAEGVKICNGLGFKAEHVVDPTLLPEIGRPVRKKEKLLVCYLMTFSRAVLLDAAVKLEEFAQRSGCKVHLFMREGMTHEMPRIPFPVTPRRARTWLGHLRSKFFSRVKIMTGAGPVEFLDSMRKARCMVTDSFHGLMFAIRNNCDIRLLKPTNANRSTMFARIEEFAGHIAGPAFSDGLDDALDSIANGDEVSYDYDWIDTWRKKSLAWLQSHATASEGKRNG